MKGEASLMEYGTCNGPIIEEKKRSGGIVHVNVQAQWREKRERMRKELNKEFITIPPH